MEALASVFACDVLTYAIMSNHMHVILRSRPDVVKQWSDETVANRWLKAFPGRRVVRTYNPSPLAFAHAYREGGYLDDAHAEVVRYLEKVSSLTDSLSVTAILRRALGPATTHKRNVARTTDEVPTVPPDRRPDGAALAELPNPDRARAADAVPFRVGGRVSGDSGAPYGSPAPDRHLRILR